MLGLCVFSFVGLFVFWLAGWLGWLGSFYLLAYPWISSSFWFLLDDVSLICVYMLICCSSVALFYCYHYFSYDVGTGLYLFCLMFLFVVVMFNLMLTYSLVLSLVMWEYLGLVSFFLILFYSNSVSLRAAVITLYASRFGDVSLFFLVSWVSYLWDMDSFWVFFLLLLVVLTKSACYPFVSWLIEAMRAPTPVSSLVHSSTLVAAGVWFLLRYSRFFTESLLSYLLVICLITIVISAVCAICFTDLKKVVALSTCNNVSWCVVFFVCGDCGLALLQLLAHGVCKCYLFMSVGDLMSSSLGGQDSKFVYSCRYSSFYGLLLQFVLVFSLCGVPFLGVFFGKHGLLSLIFYSYGWGFIILLLFCFFLSYVYSFRFYLMLVSGSLGSSDSVLSNFYLICSLVLLSGVLSFSGAFSCFLELRVMSVFESLLFLFVQLSGCAMGGLLWFGLISKFVLSGSSSLWGSDYVVSLLYRSFSFLSSSFFVALCRWEVGVLSFFYQGFSRGFCFLVDRSLGFSFNVMIFGLLLILGGLVLLF